MAGQGRLTFLSTALGVAIATLGYYVLIAPSVRDGLCGTLGSVGLRFEQLEELAVRPSTFIKAADYLPWWVWLVLVAIGLLQGGVLLLESLTTLRDNKSPAERRSWAAHLKLRALVNLLCAPLGLASSSLSAARTGALLQAQGQTRFAVLFHGLALLAILFYCSAWVAKIPGLAVTVALVLVAIQMIDEETRNNVWRSGYQPTASAGSVGVTWTFWGVVGLSVLVGSVMRYFDYGFGGGPLIVLVLGTLAMALFAKRSAVQSSAQA